MYRLFKLFWDYNLPRWSILIIDLIICVFSLTLAFFLRFDFDNIPEADLKNLPYDYAILLTIRAITFFLSKTYKGVVRYTSSRDAMRIFGIVILGSLIVFIANIISLHFINGYYFIPNSVIIIDTLVTLFLMISSRLAVKAIYFESRNPAKEKMNVIIY
ncbi:MAG: polysaccharide biosynthesis protein, partial [Bacteroidetes bacterium]|nr:polysaccharide biosynthesis protein [Bacteroidota bacterium]